MDFLSQNSLYIVLIIALVVWFGIYAYLYRIEARIKELESRMNTKGGRHE